MPVCDVCHGSGKIWLRENPLAEFYGDTPEFYEAPCEECGGTGYSHTPADAGKE